MSIVMATVLPIAWRYACEESPFILSSTSNGNSDGARHREDRHGAGPRWDLLCVDRGDGRGPLQPADRRARPAGRKAARGPAGTYPHGSRPRTSGGHRGRRFELI